MTVVPEERVREALRRAYTVTMEFDEGVGFYAGRRPIPLRTYVGMWVAPSGQHLPGIARDASRSGD